MAREQRLLSGVTVAETWCDCTVAQRRVGKHDPFNSWHEIYFYKVPRTNGIRREIYLGDTRKQPRRVKR